MHEPSRLAIRTHSHVLVAKWQVRFEHKSPAQAYNRKAFDYFRGIYVDLGVAIGAYVVGLANFQSLEIRAIVLERWTGEGYATTKAQSMQEDPYTSAEQPYRKFAKLYGGAFPMTGVAVDILEILLHISQLATEDKLDAFLDELGIPDFEDELVPPEPRKFGSRPPFDRSTFDLEAYTSEIERHFKK